MAKKTIQKSQQVKDILIRASKTFVQAFLATLSVQVATVDNWSGLKPAIVASVAAGISAVWNMILANIKK